MFKVFEHPVLGKQLIEYKTVEAWGGLSDVEADPEATPEAPRAAFSWPAFFFGPVWCVAKGFWKGLGIWLGALATVLVVVGFLTAGFSRADQEEPLRILGFFGEVGLAISAGIYANRLRVQDLLKRGYKETRTLDADNDDAALAELAKD